MVASLKLKEHHSREESHECLMTATKVRGVLGDDLEILECWGNFMIMINDGIIRGRCASQSQRQVLHSPRCGNDLEILEC